MIRSLTDEEKVQAKQYWPHMDVDKVRVTGEATSHYNCLAWTLGITTSWVWPWGTRNATKSEFDALYESYGFDPGSTGSVAAWGTSQYSMTHGSIFSTSHKTWESKCGAWLRIIHTLPDMAGGNYGNVQYYYSKQAALQKQVEKMSKDFNKENALLAAEEEALNKVIDAIDFPTKREFYEKYEKWKTTWQHPLILISSNPGDRTNSLEFLELISMGSVILPLLIGQLLQNPEDFFALQAVDRLQDQPLLVKRELEDNAILLGEQGRALETIKRWAKYYL